MNTNYPTIIPVDHESNHRLYETPYNSYSSYPDYATPTTTSTAASKLEAFDYNCWPGTPATHNILTIQPAPSTSSIIDQLQPSPSTSQTLETLIPGSSSVHLSQLNSTSNISSTHHHHHHIHQHLYPASTSSSADSSTWISPADYPTPSSYRHYSYGNNTFYDQSQWATPTSSLPPIKFESPYSPQPYFESSHNLDQPLCDSKEEPSTSSYAKCQETQPNWFKAQLTPTPPKNPANGKTRTRDKYRIVYTDRQRYELENEFSVSKYISIPRKAALSSTLALSERQIKIWFQNRRAKERKLNKKRHEMCSKQLNHSTDADSPSDGGVESPTYYQNYT